MAFNPNKLNPLNVNGDIPYENNDTPKAEDFNAIVEGVLYADNNSDDAKQIANDAKNTSTANSSEINTLKERARNHERDIQNAKKDIETLDNKNEALTIKVNDMVQPFIKQDVQGSDIFIPNTAADEIKLNIQGNTEQFVSKNIFDKNSVVSGYIDANTGVVGSPIGEYRVCSDFCRIEPNATYILSSIVGRGRIFYDKNKKFLETLLVNDSNLPFTTPSNSKYVRFNISDSDSIETLVLNKGSVLLPYSPYTGEPSPDNPIEVKSVTSPIKVKSEGGNLYDINDKELFAFEMRLSHTDTELQLTSTSSAKYVYALMPIKGYVTENMEITYSSKWQTKGKSIGRMMLVYYADNAIKKPISKSTNSGDVITSIIPPKQDNWQLSFVFYLSQDIATNVGDSTIYSDIMINYGNKLLPYIPYQPPFTKQVSLLGKDGKTYEMNGIGDVRDYISVEDSKVYLNKKFETVTFDGGIEPWELHVQEQDKDYVSFIYSNITNSFSSDTKAKSNRFNCQWKFSGLDKEYLWFYSNNLGIVIKKSRLGEISAEGFKLWLRNNNTKVTFSTQSQTAIELNISPLDLYTLTYSGGTNFTTTSKGANPVLDFRGFVLSQPHDAAVLTDRNGKPLDIHNCTKVIWDRHQEKYLDEILHNLDVSKLDVKIIPIAAANISQAEARGLIENYKENEGYELHFYTNKDNPTNFVAKGYVITDSEFNPHLIVENSKYRYEYDTQGYRIISVTREEATAVDTKATRAMQVAQSKQDKADNALETTNKTVVGGINELKENKANLTDFKYNFEQLFKNDYLSDGGSWAGVTKTRIDNGYKIVSTKQSIFVFFVDNIIPIILNHKYYLSFNSTWLGNTRFVDGTQKSGDLVFIGSSNIKQMDIITQIGETTVKPILIDLTQMFGAGNEPSTVEEVQKYLIPNKYYPFGRNVEPSIYATVEDFRYSFMQIVPTDLIRDEKLNQIQITNLHDGSITITGEYIDYQYGDICNQNWILTPGHKYYFSPNATGDNVEKIALSIYASSGFGAVRLNQSKIFTADGQRLSLFVSATHKNIILDVVVKLNIIDLTDMFGVGKEPTTIAEVQQYLVKDKYYPYGRNIEPRMYCTKAEANSLSMCPSRVVDENIISQKNGYFNYIAPSNGYLNLQIGYFSRGHIPDKLVVTNLSNNIQAAGQRANNSCWFVTVPCVKGDVIQLEISADVEITFSRFIHSKEIEL